MFCLCLFLALNIWAGKFGCLAIPLLLIPILMNMYSEMCSHKIFHVCSLKVYLHDQMYGFYWDFLYICKFKLCICFLLISLIYFRFAWSVSKDLKLSPFKSIFDLPTFCSSNQIFIRFSYSVYTFHMNFLLIEWKFSHCTSKSFHGLIIRVAKCAKLNIAVLSKWYY